MDKPDPSAFWRETFTNLSMAMLRGDLPHRPEAVKTAVATACDMADEAVSRFTHSTERNKAVEEMTSVATVPRTLDEVEKP